jgi:hypothetical protein
MHCTNQNCFDDSCQGECQQENKASQECCDNNCGCRKEQETREEAYCED